MWPSRGYVTSSASPQQRNCGAEEIDPGERIGFALEEQDGTTDRRPVTGPFGGIVGRPGRMKRIAEEHEARVVGVRLRGGQAGDTPAVRLAADRDRHAVRAGPVRHDRPERDDRSLGLLERQVDRHCVDPAAAQPLDMSVHTRG